MRPALVLWPILTTAALAKQVSASWVMWVGPEVGLCASMQPPCNPKLWICPFLVPEFYSSLCMPQRDVHGMGNEEKKNNGEPNENVPDH